MGKHTRLVLHTTTRSVSDLVKTHSNIANMRFTLSQTQNNAFVPIQAFRKSQKSGDLEGKCTDRDSQGQISLTFFLCQYLNKTAQPRTIDTTINCAQIDAYSPLTLIIILYRSQAHSYR